MSDRKFHILLWFLIQSLPELKKPFYNKEQKIVNWSYFLSVYNAIEKKIIKLEENVAYKERWHMSLKESNIYFSFWINMQAQYVLLSFIWHSFSHAGQWSLKENMCLENINKKEKSWKT